MSTIALDLCNFMKHFLYVNISATVRLTPLETDLYLQYIVSNNVYRRVKPQRTLAPQNVISLLLRIVPTFSFAER